MPNPEWSKSNVERLLRIIKECSETGVCLSASQIGSRLHPTKSRKAVIGFCHRNRILLPCRRGKNLISWEDRKIEQQVSAILTSKKKPIQKKDLIHEKWEFSEEAAGQKAVRDPVLLEKHHCRWIFGVSTYCGENTVNGGSWCSHHKDIVFGSDTNFSRKVSASPEILTPVAETRVQ